MVVFDVLDICDNVVSTHQFDKADFPISVGRSFDTLLYVGDKLVSRKHCLVCLENDELIVEDVGSRNGTIVDGKYIGKSIIHSGSVISIGLSRLRVTVT